MHFDIETPDRRRRGQPARRARRPPPRAGRHRGTRHPLGGHGRSRGQRVLRLQRRPARLDHSGRHAGRGGRTSSGSPTATGSAAHRSRLDIESDALDADYGSTGYTTRAQADELGRHLRLRPGDRLADIGSGSGWPGLYLAQQTGCHVVGTDLPLDGLQRARVALDRRRPRRPSQLRHGHRTEPAVPSRGLRRGRTHGRPLLPRPQAGRPSSLPAAAPTWRSSRVHHHPRRPRPRRRATPSRRPGRPVAGRHPPALPRARRPGRLSSTSPRST